jgi:hypothetical protein
MLRLRGVQGAGRDVEEWQPPARLALAIDASAGEADRTRLTTLQAVLQAVLAWRGRMSPGASLPAGGEAETSTLRLVACPAASAPAVEGSELLLPVAPFLPWPGATWPATPDGEEYLPARRYALLAGHYLEPPRWDPGLAEASRASLERLFDVVRELSNAVKVAPPGRLSESAERLSTELLECLEDDLDTPGALHLTWEMAHAALPPGERLALLLRADAALKLGLDEATRPADLGLPEGADGLIESRTAARAVRDWARSDALRDELAALGVEARDTPQGSSYQRVERRP